MPGALCGVGWGVACLRANDFKGCLLHHAAGVAAGEVHSPPPQPVQVCPPPTGALLQLVAHPLGQPCSTCDSVRHGLHHVVLTPTNACPPPPPPQDTQRQPRAWLLSRAPAPAPGPPAHTRLACAADVPLCLLALGIRRVAVVQQADGLGHAGHNLPHRPAGRTRGAVPGRWGIRRVIGTRGTAQGTPALLR